MLAPICVSERLLKCPTLYRNHMQHCSAMIEPTFVGDQLQAAIIEMDLYQVEDGEAWQLCGATKANHS